MSIARTKILLIFSVSAGVFFSCFYGFAQDKALTIKPGDTVYLTVDKNPGLNKPLLVSPESTVEYPLIGSIDVRGFTTVDLAQEFKKLFKSYYFLETGVFVSYSETENENRNTEEKNVTVANVSDKYENRGGVYTISPYDTIRISVYGEEDLEKVLEVSAEGTVRYALLGKIQVAGLTGEEVAKKISDMLAQGYLTNPQVSVAIEQYSKISVLGSVNEPGSYELRGALTLVDALVLAGGPKEDANLHKIKIIRHDAEGKGLVVDIDEEGRQFYLKPLDKILVEEYGQIYVVGAVKEPGVFMLETSALTALDAIVFLAKGPLENANLSKVKVIRDNASGKKEFILDVNADPNGFFITEGDRISVSEYKDISIFGQVETPGNYPYSKGLTAVEAISLAGGFTEVASTNGVKILKQKGNKKEVIKVPVGYILKTGDKSRDVILEEGDTVVVAESWF
ncbi:MAG: polysaccharide biosynthesis/export family protein [Candidatus Omnitrophica bacterium]|nr:polysaccharide biosynthesis/export family protein [Candidatus Omnitrophota bacterium]